MNKLEEDKLWAEQQTLLEEARTPQETHWEALRRINQQNIARELAQLTELKRKRFRTPHEL